MKIFDEDTLVGLTAIFAFIAICGLIILFMMQYLSLTFGQSLGWVLVVCVISVPVLCIARLIGMIINKKEIL